MEQAPWLNLALLFLFILFLLKFILKIPANPKNLPPSPPAIPIIGHLHLLKEPLHRTLDELSEKYGHIILLQFGVRKVLIVSSASAAEECFTRNDIIFANRPKTLGGKHLNYNYRTIGFSNYGDHWRNLRRLTTIELFSTSRITMLSSIRHDEIRLLVKKLFQVSSKKPVKVEVSTNLRDVVFNIMLRTIAGKRYYGNDVVDKEAKQFQELLGDYTELLKSSNLNDFLPVLQWVDFQGVEKRMKSVMERLDKFLQHLVDEHRQMRSKSTVTSDTSGAGNREGKMTLVDLLLSLHETEPEFYTDVTIRSVMLAMLIAGTETTTTTLEWALSLLLNHPESMRMASAEIDSIVGLDRILSEPDLSRLNYLQNIIKEAFRLFPAVPLLLPHESSEDCSVCGFDVPGGTMLLVNTWTIHRDPKLWKDPTRFMPERFEGGEDEGYKLLPFGAGRRICPGAVLARRVVGLVLGALIQSFEWERVSEDKINMAEGTGLTLPRAEPLEAICKPRKAIMNLHTTL